MIGGSGRWSGGGGREPGCSTRGDTERRGGGGGGTGRAPGGAGGIPGLTGGGGTDGEGAPDREGIGSGATGARRGGAEAPAAGAERPFKIAVTASMFTTVNESTGLAATPPTYQVSLQLPSDPAMITSFRVKLPLASVDPAVAPTAEPF